MRGCYKPLNEVQGARFQENLEIHVRRLLCKSMDWFLCDNGLRHERVKSHFQSLERSD